MAETRKKWERTPRPVPDLDALPGSTLLDTELMHKVTGYAKITLKIWRAKGRGPRVTIVEGRPRYAVKDVRAWLSGGTGVVTG